MQQTLLLPGIVDAGGSLSASLHDLMLLLHPAAALATAAALIIAI